MASSLDFSRADALNNPPGKLSDAPRGHCDPKAAINRLAGAVDLYGELLVTFFAGADESLRRIRQAAEQENADELHRAAHQLRGVAATCGAEEVVHVTDRLEQMGRTGEVDGSLPLCDQLVDEMALARRELAPYLPDSAAGR